jgi:hypothetical protein
LFSLKRLANAEPALPEPFKINIFFIIINLPLN